jgi:signal transduction histidine kinase
MKLYEGMTDRLAQSGETMPTEGILADSHAANLGPTNRSMIKEIVGVPLHSKDKVIGMLCIAMNKSFKFSSEDMRLLESIAAQIAISVDNTRLYQEVQRKEEIRGELLQDLFMIQEEERRRIARELHDETSQVLAGLTASLQAALDMLSTDANKSKAILRKAQTLSVSLLDEIHRLIYELRPALLDDLGMMAAVEWLADSNLKKAGITVNFKTMGRARRLPPQLETTLFRVIQEAFANIVKHSHANNTEVSLHFEKRLTRVHIRDDGIGFDIEEAIDSKDRPRGLGLLGMKERVELMNGTLDIRSGPGAGGTEINIEIPLNYEGSSG